MKVFAAALVMTIGAPVLASDLSEGIGLYEEGEFEQAALALERAARDLAPGQDRAEAYLYLGLCRAVVGHADAARASFVAALADDPKAAPDPARTKPNIMALFEETRARWARAAEAARAAESNVLEVAPVTTSPTAASPSTTTKQDVIGEEAADLNATPDGSGVRPAHTMASSTGPRDQTWSQRWLWPTILGGAGVSLAAVGAGFGLAALDDEREYQRRRKKGTLSEERFQALRERGGDRALVANLFYGASALALASGVAVWFLDDDVDASLRVAVSPSGVSAAWSLW